MRLASTASRPNNETPNKKGKHPNDGKIYPFYNAGFFPVFDNILRTAIPNSIGSSARRIVMASSGTLPGMEGFERCYCLSFVKCCCLGEHIGAKNLIFKMR